MELEQTIIKLPDDYEGVVQATLISASSNSASRAVLYIHGYIDYFFQTHMAENFVAHGWNFYAIDLRKYGRSILPNQHPYYCHTLNEYFPEIDKSLELISKDKNSTIVLMGHSTGGLIASLYASRGRNRGLINALILNSPFFEFNTTAFKKKIAIPMSEWIGKLLPYAYKRNELSPHYFASVHCSINGEWDFDTKFKPQSGVPLYFAWLNAIRRGQRELKRGLEITTPILVMHSDHSTSDNDWSDNYTNSDTVLNIKDIKHYTPMLGSNITIIEIENGIHDLILSSQKVRDKAFKVIFDWLDKTV